MKKKGQIDGVQGFIMVIVGIAVILAVGLIVAGELKTSTMDTIATTGHTNATKTITLDVFNTFPECVDDRDMTVSAVYNSSYVTDCLLDSGNYTVSDNTINISDDGIAGSACASVGTSVNVSYSCKYPSVAYNATATNITKLATIPTWIGILIVVALAMLVLGYFYSRK